MATYVKGASQVSLALQVLMGLAFIWWWMFWFLQPIQTARNWLRKADAHISQDFLGTRGEFVTFGYQIYRFKSKFHEFCTLQRFASMYLLYVFIFPRIFHNQGSTWLLQVLPFMIIAFLSYFAIVLKGKIRPSTRSVILLWT